MRRDWTTGEVARLRELRASGASEAACAAALGRTRGAVSGALFRLGMSRTAPPWKRRAGELRRAVRRHRKRGVTWIADALGVSRQTVYAAIRSGA